MKDLQREILSQVAAGTLCAEEGAARLDSLGDTAGATASAVSPTPPAPLHPASVVRQVRVVRSLEVQNRRRPKRRLATAEGPHRARQEGDTMVIEHEPFDDMDSFSFGHGRHIAVNGFGRPPAQIDSAHEPRPCADRQRPGGQCPGQTECMGRSPATFRPATARWPAFVEL